MSSNIEHTAQKTAHCWVDGSARGAPGTAGVGIHITDWRGKDLYKGGGWIGNATNNQAEYAAMLAGLLTVESLGYRFVQMYSDSETVVHQINGLYQLKSPNLFRLAGCVATQLRRFQEWEVLRIPRTHNHIANSIAQAVTNKKSPYRMKEYNDWFWGEVKRLENERLTKQTF